jgi:hypothetical protein
VPDQPIHLAPMFRPTKAVATVGASPAASAANACPPDGQVQLNPEALEQIHADSDSPSVPTAHKLGFDGSGVVIGFVADGLDIHNPDFIRLNGQHVFIDYKDFGGVGTSAPTGGEEAFGDAASIATQGREVYNVEGYGPHAVTTPRRIRVEGVASGHAAAEAVGHGVRGHCPSGGRAEVGHLHAGLASVALHRVADSTM